jgi:hypothetical protein
MLFNALNNTSSPPLCAFHLPTTTLDTRRSNTVAQGRTGRGTQGARHAGWAKIPDSSIAFALLPELLLHHNAGKVLLGTLLWGPMVFVCERFTSFATLYTPYPRGNVGLASF